MSPKLKNKKEMSDSKQNKESILSKDTAHLLHFKFSNL